MSEEIEYLSQEEIDAAAAISNLTTIFYIHYEADGSIVSIVREKNNNYSFIEIDGKLVEDFISGKKNVASFKIKNPGLTDATFVEKYKPISFVNGLFFIPTVTSIDTIDLAILQDVKNNCWNFQLTSDGKNKIDNSNIHQTIKFYVSIKDNPNFLLNTIECTLAQLIEGYSTAFSSKYESRLEAIDITTLKTFTSYGKLLNV